MSVDDRAAVSGFAAGSSEASPWVTSRPPVVAVKDGAARVVVRRETEDDLLRLDME